MLANALRTWMMNPLRVVLILSFILFVFGLSFFGTVMRQYGYQPLQPLQVERPASNETAPTAADDPTALLAKLWKPMVQGITERTFRAANGRDYSLSDGEQVWTQPLGSSVLILDVDSRFNTDQGNLMNQTRMHRNVVEKKTAGRLAHMIYAMIHGYDYRFVRAPDFPDRHGTWAKVPIIREATKQYDTVVFLDADAGFVNMALPLEWLLNYWHVKPETSLTMAKDPDTPINHDSKGLVLLNTGFIIARRNDRTHEILRALEDCVEDDAYPGCSQWKRDWAHEQRAFGEYIRYDYNKTTDVLALSTTEANGPAGIFVRHDWPKQRDPLEDLQNSFMDMLVGRAHMQFHDELDHYYKDISELPHPLSDVEI